MQTRPHGALHSRAGRWGPDDSPVRPPAPRARFEEDFVETPDGAPVTDEGLASSPDEVDEELLGAFDGRLGPARRRALPRRAGRRARVALVVLFAAALSALAVRAVRSGLRDGAGAPPATAPAEAPRPRALSGVESFAHRPRGPRLARISQSVRVLRHVHVGRGAQRAGSAILVVTAPPPAEPDAPAQLSAARSASVTAEFGFER